MARIPINTESLTQARSHEAAKQTKYERLRAFLVERQEPGYRFRQITHAIFSERVGQFERMTALPQTLRNALRTAFGDNILSIQPVFKRVSQQATKLLFRLPDGNKVETVGMRYRAGWESFCISSQCGCGFGCRFCATGAIGLKRNLTADEITDQLLYFHLQGHALDSISFMGMGEALANPQTFTALRILTAPLLFALSPRRITVSTIGVIPNIRRLRREFPQVNLTFSLHSPFQEQRSELLPLNRMYSLHDVLLELDEYIRSSGRKVYIAYIMLHGVNDTPRHARGMIELLTGRGPWDHLYHVNMIRYNPALGVPESYVSSDEQTVKEFARELKNAGLHVTVRQSFGVDIDAACGQLYGQYQAKPSINAP